MHARYYHAKTGRFTRVDPLGSSANLDRPQTWNRYAYVEGNPLRYLDPTGEGPYDFLLRGTQGLGGATAGMIGFLLSELAGNADDPFFQALLYGGATALDGVSFGVNFTGALIGISAIVLGGPTPISPVGALGTGLSLYGMYGDLNAAIDHYSLGMDAQNRMSESDFLNGIQDLLSSSFDFSCSAT